MAYSLISFDYLIQVIEKVLHTEIDLNQTYADGCKHSDKIL